MPDPPNRKISDLGPKGRRLTEFARRSPGDPTAGGGHRYDGGGASLPPSAASVASRLTSFSEDFFSRNESTVTIG